MTVSYCASSIFSFRFRVPRLKVIGRVKKWQYNDQRNSVGIVISSKEQGRFMKVRQLSRNQIDVSQYDDMGKIYQHKGKRCRSIRINAVSSVANQQQMQRNPWEFSWKRIEIHKEIFWCFYWLEENILSSAAWSYLVGSTGAEYIRNVREGNNQ